MNPGPFAVAVTRNLKPSFTGIARLPSGRHGQGDCRGVHGVAIDGHGGLVEIGQEEGIVTAGDLEVYLAARLKCVVHREGREINRVPRGRVVSVILESATRDELSLAPGRMLEDLRIIPGV